ncbi:hypothetical protein ES702_03923 [subsurface metagenome]
MKTNLLKAIEEMKEQIMSGWSSHERTHFDDFLEDDIKPYWSNLYLLLNGDFEAELLAKIEESSKEWKSYQTKIQNFKVDEESYRLLMERKLEQLNTLKVILEE